MRVTCTHNFLYLWVIIAGDGSARGEARLVGGAAAAAGGWEYGRVQVSDGTFFRSVLDRNSFPNLGRRGAQVACHSLGFDSGAKLLSGTRSGLPGNDNALATSERFLCTGREETMDDCSMEVDIFREYDDDVPGLSAVAVICASGSGVASDSVRMHVAHESSRIQAVATWSCMSPRNLGTHAHACTRRRVS